MSKNRIQVATRGRRSVGGFPKTVKNPGPGRPSK